MSKEEVALHHLQEYYNIPTHWEDYKTIQNAIKENQQLKSKLEASEKARNKCSSRIKTLGKFDGETCTRSLKLWKADFNELINILDIDKGE